MDRQTGDATPAHPDPQASIALLFTEHRLGLVRLAVLLVGDQRLAEDIVQDAFLGLMRRWPGLHAPERALPYTRACVVNGATSALRRRARWRRRSAPYEPPTWPAESAALLGEDRRAVMDALRRLAPRRRAVLVLRYYLDLGDGEIAEMLGTTPATVRSSATRALRALGNLLGEES